MTQKRAGENAPSFVGYEGPAGIGTGHFIREKIEQAAQQFPNRIALQLHRDGVSSSYTYRQVAELADDVYQSLKSRGIEKSDPVAMWSPSTPEWAIACLGILYSGAAIVPLDVDGNPGQIASILTETGCKLIFTVPEKLTSLGKLCVRLPVPPMIVSLGPVDGSAGIHFTDRTSSDDAPFPPQMMFLEDVAAIVYTSGTTGLPRGVVLPYRSVATTVLGMLQYADVGAADNVLAVVPSHHVLALVASLLVPLCAGATTTYLHTVKSTELMKAISDSKVTIFPCVPQVFYAIHKRIFTEVSHKPRIKRVIFGLLLRLSMALRQFGINPGRVFFSPVHRMFGGCLRLLVSAGSYCDPTIIRDLYCLGFTVQQGYGLTENFGGGTFTPTGFSALGSAGIALPKVELRILDPDASGAGEIAVGGDSIMRGYFNDPGLTSDVLRDGWIRTGDLGYLDKRGNLHITGRTKDLIVLSSGKKLSPDEIEQHYQRSPYVKELCVLGVPDASGYAGAERLHAVVVPDVEYLKQHKVVNSREALRHELEGLSTQLPAYRRILSYEIQSRPLPRTATRKLIRRIIREEVLCRTQRDDSETPNYTWSESDELLLKTPAARRVCEAIRREARISSVLHPDMNMELDLGLDSLQRIELIASIEQALDIRLSSDAIAQCFTIRDLLAQVAHQSNEDSSVMQNDTEMTGVTWNKLLTPVGAGDIEQNPALCTRPILTFVEFLILKLVFAISRLTFKLEVEGVNNLPRKGPYLICPNHQGYLDALLVASVLPYSVVQDLLSLGRSSYFTTGLRAFVAQLIRTVPVDPDRHLLPALRLSTAWLRRGKILLIFPEGGMSVDGSLRVFKKGAAVLALELQVPIVPVAIRGSFNVWSKGSDGFRMASVKVRVGRPFLLNLPELVVGTDDDAYSEGTRKIQNAIGDLLKKP